MSIKNKKFRQPLIAFIGVLMIASLAVGGHVSNLQGYTKVRDVRNNTAPDLMIQNLVVDPTTRALSFEVKNLSKNEIVDEAAQKNGELHIFYNSSETPALNYSWPTLDESSKGFFKANGVGTFQPAVLSAEIMEVKVCIDPTHVVTERNEDNNCAVLEVPVADSWTEAEEV
ncbi:MAG: hypothetical protein ACD_28C00208G0002 [uncultured bacterium]|nr:MAG: hypothetical protein ACD_28C00208G0002 [uncultured bacterium]KKT76750.1 MAG: hypothetical protein UW70_C0014G0016 [Candidatus Peregrinibacteria bacterium GW2011_GWA2_44_7]